LSYKPIFNGSKAIPWNYYLLNLYTFNFFGNRINISRTIKKYRRHFFYKNVLNSN